MTEIEDILVMLGNDWKLRLSEAITKSGKSKRAISLAAGMGPGYVHSILAEGKDPTIENLMKICREADVSLPYVIYGLDFTAMDDDLLKLIGGLPDQEKKAFLALLRSRAPTP